MAKKKRAPRRKKPTQDLPADLAWVYSHPLLGGANLGDPIVESYPSPPSTGAQNTLHRCLNNRTFCDKFFLKCQALLYSQYADSDKKTETADQKHEAKTLAELRGIAEGLFLELEEKYYDEGYYKKT